MKHRKNPRLVKVKTIIPSDSVNRIISNVSRDSILVKEHVKSCSYHIRKNDDDNTSLIQKDLDSFRNYVEKSFVILFIVLFLDCLVNILG